MPESTTNMASRNQAFAEEENKKATGENGSVAFR